LGPIPAWGQEVRNRLNHRLSGRKGLTEEALKPWRLEVTCQVVGAEHTSSPNPCNNPIKQVLQPSLHRLGCSPERGGVSSQNRERKDQRGDGNQVSCSFPPSVRFLLWVVGLTSSAHLVPFSKEGGTLDCISMVHEGRELV
jgi:hypothetical protein